MKKRVISIVLVLILAVSLCVPVYADFDPNTRDSVAVVYTCLDLDGGEYGFGWGSGFFVGEAGVAPTYLITNYHVISDFVEFGQGELTTIAVNGQEMTGRSKIRVHYDSDDYEEAYVVGYDSIKDIALLKLGAPTDKRIAIPLEVPTDAAVGSTVYAVGYPGLAENVFADATTSWGKSDSTVTSGTISRMFLTAGTGTSSIQIDCVIKSGNSGGPLVNDSGAAIGINTYNVSDADNNSIYYAVNISEAITLLNQYGVAYGTASSAAEIPAAEDAAVPVVEAPAPEPESAGFPVVPVVIGAVVVVIVAVVVVLLLQKKKKTQKAPDPMPVVPPAPVKQGYVRSLSSQHRGSRIPVGSQGILLGRSQECAVVYQSNTPGVSGRHASLTFDAVTGDFILTDLQSTYGTYLKNGQKLTPNMAYRLRSGDQFYLGEAANLLQVDMG